MNTANKVEAKLREIWLSAGLSSDGFSLDMDFKEFCKTVAAARAREQRAAYAQQAGGDA